MLQRAPSTTAKNRAHGLDPTRSFVYYRLKSSTHVILALFLNLRGYGFAGKRIGNKGQAPIRHPGDTIAGLAHSLYRQCDLRTPFPARAHLIICHKSRHASRCYSSRPMASLSNEFTRSGLAWPRVAFMTWPTRNANALSLPDR